MEGTAQRQATTETGGARVSENDQSESEPDWSRETPSDDQMDSEVLERLREDADEWLADDLGDE